jgi:hypothetical protein
MSDIRNRQIEPLCRFGPGGDFVASWQPEPSIISESANVIVKIMAIMIEAVVIIVGLRRVDTGIRLRKICFSGELKLHNREEIRNAIQDGGTGGKTDSEAVTIAEDGSSLSAEPMLFPDIGGDGVGIEHQPKHRIRTYRRTAKKRPAFGFCEQGSLFEGQFASARTA